MDSSDDEAGIAVAKRQEELDCEVEYNLFSLFETFELRLRPTGTEREAQHKLAVIDRKLRGPGATMILSFQVLRAAIEQAIQAAGGAPLVAGPPALAPPAGKGPRPSSSSSSRSSR